MDQAFDWDADGSAAARRWPEQCLEVMAQLYPPEAAAEYVDGWTVDPARYT